MKRHAGSELMAEKAKEVLLERWDRPEVAPNIGVILGTGWGDELKLDNEHSVPMGELPGFERLGELNGHHRKAAYGFVKNVPVAALRGRVHLNEHLESTTAGMVRLQVEMLLALGVKTLILTAAVGSLAKNVEVGSLFLPDGFITLFAPPLPGFAGEFGSPEDTLKENLRELAKGAAADHQLVTNVGGHVMVRGPFFEGRRYDKKFLAMSGAKVVGMSILPEACIASLYGASVVAPCFVTNTASEEHSHETNQERAKKSSVKLGGFLASLITRIASR